MKKMILIIVMFLIFTEYIPVKFSRRKAIKTCMMHAEKALKSGEMTVQAGV